MKEFALHTILKTDGRYLEIVDQFPSGAWYKLMELEGDHVMGIDARVISEGIEAGTWEIVE